MSGSILQTRRARPDQAGQGSARRGRGLEAQPRCRAAATSGADALGHFFDDASDDLFELDLDVFYGQPAGRSAADAARDGLEAARRLFALSCRDFLARRLIVLA